MHPMFYHKADGPRELIVRHTSYIPDGSSIYTSLMNTSFAENGVPIVYNASIGLHSLDSILAHTYTNILVQIFEHSPGLPNYMTFLLSRSSGGLTNGGLLTVCESCSCSLRLSSVSHSIYTAEVLSNLKDILKAPLLDSISPINWQTVLDGVYLNGKRLLGGKQYGNSTASPGTTWRRPALLDTGTTRSMYHLFCYDNNTITFRYSSGNLQSLHLFPTWRNSISIYPELAACRQKMASHCTVFLAKRD